MKGELEYDEIEAIFAEYGKVNPRKFSLKDKDEKKNPYAPDGLK